MFIDFSRFLQISTKLSVYIDFGYENKSPRPVFYAISDSGTDSGDRMMLSDNFQKYEFFGYVTGKDCARSPSLAKARLEINRYLSQQACRTLF